MRADNAVLEIRFTDVDAINLLKSFDLRLRAGPEVGRARPRYRKLIIRRPQVAVQEAMEKNDMVGIHTLSEA